MSKQSRQGRIYLDKIKCEEGLYRGQHKATGCKFGTCFDGVGILKYKDGQVYEGNWVNGVRQGHGRLVHANGKSYQGEWSQDQANGQGIYENPQEGYKYEGLWLNDTLNGSGREIWDSNGSQFEGEFLANSKEGEGHFIWQDGSYYKGGFQGNTFHGYGEYHFAEQEMTYYGSFDHGEMHGQGKQVWSDGREYMGGFQHGMKSGEGTFIADNKMYVGMWEKNVKHGIGHEEDLRGHTRRKGEWKKGKLFRWLGKTETVSGSLAQNGRFQKSRAIGGFNPEQQDNFLEEIAEDEQH